MSGDVCALNSHGCSTRVRQAGPRVVRCLAASVIVSIGLGLAVTPARAGRLAAWPGPPSSPRSLAGVLARAQPGDTVFVHPGVYRGTFELRRGVSLLGIAGPDSTVLDADGGRYVLSGRDLDSTTVVAGLTLQHGRRDHPNSGGGGLYLFRSSPIVAGNVFRAHLGYLGPGIYMNYGSHPVIAGNVFRDNEGYLGGALAAYEGCDPLVYGNWLHDNRAVSGGGMLCLRSAPVVLHNTFVANSASRGGGAIYCNEAPALVADNIFAHNADDAANPGAVYFSSPERPATVRGNVLWENTGGPNGGHCPPLVGQDGNRAAAPDFEDLATRRLGLREERGVPAAGAPSWSTGAVPAVPDSVLAVWREWRRAHAER